MAPASTAADDETRRQNAFGNDWTELLFERSVLAFLIEIVPPATRAGGAGGLGRPGH